MAEPLKYHYNEAFVRQLAAAVAEPYPSFHVPEFVASVLDDDWEQRELKDRMRHVTTVLGAYLPDYPQALEILRAVVDRFSGLQGMVFPDYVEVFGIEYPDLSLETLGYFTRFSTAEFAVRPFIQAHETLAMRYMLRWSQDQNHHVRRLASEGCRPRLPWAIALPAFKTNPGPVLPVLDNLKNDDSLYVRKSVANHLNDISKDNPDIALQLAREWYGLSQQADWIVKHGLRTLLKKGNETALTLLGFGQPAGVKVFNLKLSSQAVAIGSDLSFSFAVNNSAEAVKVKIGYVVDYKKANGRATPKIFHVAERQIDSGEVCSFSKRLSFRDLTTRKHYTGGHKLAITINGIRMLEEEFEVVDG